SAGQGNAHRRFAAQRIVVEDGKAGKRDQKQAKQRGDRLEHCERQPETALFVSSFLSERGAQFVGRLCHGSSRISPVNDTTAGQPCGIAKGRGLGGARQQKGRPKGPPFATSRGAFRAKRSNRDQFAFFSAGLLLSSLDALLSFAALSFEALSFLASGDGLTLTP